MIVKPCRSISLPLIFFGTAIFSMKFPQYCRDVRNKAKEEDLKLIEGTIIAELYEVIKANEIEAPIHPLLARFVPGWF